ncbi:sulfite exporter TauE/SafE family protein [Actinoplanes sp. NBRC 101535]|uniref:sulfite exporter TauE/SafE family protein n=1 Tax=Actinoplanes sp. NBRC 101535 TaxID=3032196 RepID=UPI002556DBD6|nr:sulfite exporter TauE/SafE family protein [Actinoplanes sp. NBRC 101535]
MDLDHVVLLFVGGIGSGLTGSMAGLASLVSYPVLLAVGIPPVAANVTNNVALLASVAGSAAGSRRELRGQGLRIARLGVLSAAGGLGGAVLLLSTPSSAFERVVPWLIAVGAFALLFRDQLRSWYARPGVRPPVGLAVFVIAIYGGYFGAAAGVLMLAALSLAASEPFAVSNAVKTAVLGGSNLAAAALYAAVAPVHWTAAALLAAGCLLGSWLGPALVRRTPEWPLRIAIAVAALVLAGYLWHDTGTASGV